MKRIVMIVFMTLSCVSGHAQWYYQYRLGSGNMEFQSAGPFASKSECEASRNAILSQKGLDFSDVVAGGASLSWSATPCTGRGTSGIGNTTDLNNYHLLGVDQGQASFINNPGQDIEQWYKEWQRKHDIIVPAPHSSGLLLVSNEDYDFIQKYENRIKADEEDGILRIGKGLAPKGRGIAISERALNDKFVPLNMREEYSSDDLAFIDNVPAMQSADNVYEEPKHPIVDWTFETLKNMTDVGFLFLKGAGLTAGILAHANFNLYRELYKCVMDGCVSTNKIFRDAWGIDFKVATEKISDFINGTDYAEGKEVFVGRILSDGVKEMLADEAAGFVTDPIKSQTMYSIVNIDKEKLGHGPLYNNLIKHSRLLFAAVETGSALGDAIETFPLEAWKEWRNKDRNVQVSSPFLGGSKGQ